MGPLKRVPSSATQCACVRQAAGHGTGATAGGRRHVAGYPRPMAVPLCTDGGAAGSERAPGRTGSSSNSAAVRVAGRHLGLNPHAAPALPRRGVQRCQGRVHRGPPAGDPNRSRARLQSETKSGQLMYQQHLGEMTCRKSRSRRRGRPRSGEGPTRTACQGGLLAPTSHPARMGRGSWRIPRFLCGRHRRWIRPGEDRSRSLGGRPARYGSRLSAGEAPVSSVRNRPRARAECGPGSSEATMSRTTPESSMRNVTRLAKPNAESTP